MGRWYLVHIGIQAFGLLLGLAGFLLAVTQFNPIPLDLAHFQLGVAVIILALFQPLNSLPRLTMHHVSLTRSRLPLQHLSNICLGHSRTHGLTVTMLLPASGASKEPSAWSSGA